MADIFDLAQSINRQKKQATQGYSSPLEMLPLQVAQIMATRDKEKRVSLKNDSEFLSKMIANAKTPEQLANVTNLTNTHIKETYRDPETRLYGEALGMQIDNKNSAHKSYIAAMKWADSMSNKEVGYDDGTESGIKRKNALELSEDDLTSLTGDDFKNLFETYQGYEDAIAQGQAHEFKYTRGKSSNKTLITQLGKYRDTLDSAIQAHLSGKVITDNEAVCIAMGKYNECKKEVVGDISKDIKHYRDSISRTQKAIDALRKSGLDKQILMSSPLMATMDSKFLDESGIDTRDSVEKIIKDLEARRNRYQTDDLDPLIKRKYFWTGMKEDIQVSGSGTQSEPPIFTDGGDEDEESLVSDEEPPVSEEIEDVGDKGDVEIEDDSKSDDNKLASKYNLSQGDFNKIMEGYSSEDYSSKDEYLRQATMKTPSAGAPDLNVGELIATVFDEVENPIAPKNPGAIMKSVNYTTSKDTQAKIKKNYGGAALNLLHKLYETKKRMGEDSKQYKNLYKRLEKHIAKVNK